MVTKSDIERIHSQWHISVLMNGSISKLPNAYFMSKKKGNTLRFHEIM